MAKQKMVQLNTIWKDRGITKDLKVKILKCLIWPVVLYGCEAWTLKKDDENKLNAAEMWFFRRLLRITWKDKRSNESVLTELSVQRKLLPEIKKRKMKYLGHANRNTKTNLMTSVLQGKMDAKRNPGRPPKSYMSNITSASGLRLQDVVWQSRENGYLSWHQVELLPTNAAMETGDR